MKISFLWMFIYDIFYVLGWSKMMLIKYYRKMSEVDLHDPFKYRI